MQWDLREFLFFSNSYHHNLWPFLLLFIEFADNKIPWESCGAIGARRQVSIRAAPQFGLLRMPRKEWIRLCLDLGPRASLPEKISEKKVNIQKMSLRQLALSPPPWSLTTYPGQSSGTYLGVQRAETKARRDPLVLPMPKVVPSSSFGFNPAFFLWNWILQLQLGIGSWMEKYSVLSKRLKLTGAKPEDDRIMMQGQIKTTWNFMNGCSNSRTRQWLILNYYYRKERLLDHRISCRTT